MNKVRHRALFLPAILATFSASCGDARPNAPIEREERLSELDEIAATQIGDTAANSPNDTISQAIYNELLGAASRTYPGDDPFARLVEHFRDHPLGAQLVSYHYNELLAQSEVVANEFLETLIGEGGAQTHAAALQLYLRQLAKNDGIAFEVCAGRFIENGESDRMKRIALYERMRFRADGRPREAALDALLFASRFPEAVENMRLRPYFAARLDSAGFALESVLIERGGLKPQAIEFLYASRAKASSGPIGSALTYPNSAPDGDENEHAAPTEELTTTLEFPLHDLREAFSCRSAGDIELFQQNLGRCVQRVQQSSHAFDDNLLNVATELFRSIFQALVSTVIGPPDPSTARTKQLLCGVLQCSMTTAALAAERDQGASASAIAPITVEYVRGLEALENWRAVIEAYDAFLARFPTSDKSAEIAVARASVFWKRMGDFETAYVGYGQAAALYGESSDAAQCVLNQALIRIEAERYDDAYDLCQELLLKKQPRSIEGPAEYILAMCEVGLGYAEEGRERMARVADSFAGDFAGERALYWLGMSAVGELDYERAEARLAEYVERYPNGADVGGAKHALHQIAASDRTSK